MQFSLQSLFLFLLSFAWTAISIPVRLEERLLGLNATLPSQDPFYQPTAGYENAAPGDILNTRQIPIPTALEVLTPGTTKSVWQIQYRSTDDAGNPTAVITTIFVPLDGDANKFFTQSIAYDSSDVDASPSYALRVVTQAGPDYAAIALALYSGWFVQSPDYESFNAVFTNGVISAHGMLDSLRAGLASNAYTGLLPSARVALNGGSGGALAIEWALELQPTYAPELDIAGVTLGSLTPNIADVMNEVDGGAFAGLIPSSITGLMRASADLTTYVNANLIPSKAATFMSANTRSLNDNQAYYAGQNIASYFLNPKWLEDPVPAALVQKVGIMGLHGVPQVPVYIYKGAEDTISSVDDTDALVEKYCAANIGSLTYVRNIVTGHETESFLGFIGAYEYLQERLNGVAAIGGCTIINSTKSTLNNDDATALGALGNKVVNILDNALPALLSS